MLNRAELESLHTFSSGHRKILAGAARAGCFSCGVIFSPSEIVERVDSRQPRGAGPNVGVTALCPHCGIDAVLPETVTIVITPALLEAMRAYWFT